MPERQHTGVSVIDATVVHDAVTIARAHDVGDRRAANAEPDRRNIHDGKARFDKHNDIRSDDSVHRGRD